MSDQDPKKPEDEPKLFEKSYIKEQKSPPWIMIGFLLFALATVMWKKYVTPTLKPETKVIVGTVEQSPE